MRRSVALFALVVAVNSAAQAQYSSQSWTMCSVGDLSACGTFVLETNGVRTGAIRTGTDVSLRVTNRQGSIANDNTLYSYFTTMVFLGHFTGMFATPGPQHLTPTAPPGQTAETDSWAWESGMLGTDLARLIVYSPGLESTVAGCDPVDPAFGPSSPSIYTCTTVEYATFAFQTASLFDASDFASLRFDVQGIDDPAADDIMADQCSAFPDKAREFDEEVPCDVLEHSVVYPPGAVVPEPATVTLVALGLVGVGIAVRRRRA